MECRWCVRPSLAGIPAEIDSTALKDAASQPTNQLASGAYSSFRDARGSKMFFNKYLRWWLVVSACQVGPRVVARRAHRSPTDQTTARRCRCCCCLAAFYSTALSNLAPFIFRSAAIAALCFLGARCAPCKYSRRARSISLADARASLFILSPADKTHQHRPTSPQRPALKHLR